MYIYIYCSIKMNIHCYVYIYIYIVASAVPGGLCVKLTFLFFPAFWGRVGWDVNVRWHLHHEVDATSRMGLGGVGWDVNVRWHLRHEVDATLKDGSGWGGVGC